VDHAVLGAWLLEYWKLPELLCRTVALSHTPQTADASTPAGMAARCVALASECVELLLAPAAAEGFSALVEHASAWLGIDAPMVADVVAKIVAEMPEVERLFDRKLLQPDAAGAILDQARDLLVLRNLQALGQVDSLRAADRKPEASPVAPQDERQRDSLTELYNRGYFDLLLRREFQSATNGSWPLSVVAVDVGVNEIYAAEGPEAGDSVLVTLAKAIASVARDTDCVARNGGTQFVILLPGLASPGAEIFRERLIARLRGTQHMIRGTAVTVAFSVGLATHTPQKPFQRASLLMNAAERSAGFAHKAGLDPRVREHSGRPAALKT
jgi:diguanylate cyclase (GGDEF)-like protein